MKKIVISGSCKLKSQVSYWCNYFKKRGYKVLDFPFEASCESENVFRDFYRHIENTDTLFIMNEDKDGIEGYIGPNTFAELVYAVMQNQNHNKNIEIYLLKMPSASSSYYDTIETFISNNWITLFNFSLLEDLNNYIPFNEPEEKDKELFFNYFNLHSNLSFNPIELLLMRENTLAHFSASAFVVNKTKDKILVVNHNILGGWIYPGGHADGKEYLLSVAIREVKEETGIKAIPLDNSIFGIQAVPIPGHTKKGKYVSPHIHFDVIYLLEADDTLPLKSKPDENTDVKWISLDESIYEIFTDSMKPIFSKLIEKLKNFK